MNRNQSAEEILRMMRETKKGLHGPKKEDDPVKYAFWQMHKCRVWGAPFNDLTDAQEAAVGALGYMDDLINKNPFKRKESNKAGELYAKYLFLNNPSW